MTRLLVALSLLLAGCASSTAWQDWHAHDTHFASSEHLAYSLMPAGRDPHHERKIAGRQHWWGEPYPR